MRTETVYLGAWGFRPVVPPEVRQWIFRDSLLLIAPAHLLPLGHPNMRNRSPWHVGSGHSEASVPGLWCITGSKPSSSSPSDASFSYMEQNWIAGLFHIFMIMCNMFFFAFPFWCVFFLGQLPTSHDQTWKETDHRCSHPGSFRTIR